MSFLIHCTPTIVGGGGEGLAEEATRISDSSSEDDSDRLAKKAGGKKKVVFQNNGWCSSRGYDMGDKPWCVCTAGHVAQDTFCKWIYTIQSSVIKITQRKPKAQDVQGPLHHTKLPAPPHLI